MRGNKALIIKRGHEPRKGEWSLPGGIVELGESLVDAVKREVLEETGLIVEAGPIVETFDRVHRDPDGRIRYHFVIVDYLCASPVGDAVAGSDADAVAWAAAEEIDGYGINPHAAEVIRRGLRLDQAPSPKP